MPNYKRGSFFPSPGQQRYKPPDVVEDARHRLMLLKHEMEEAEKEEAEDVPRETCETLDDHDFVESERYLHTMECTKCGAMVEHPARWYAQHPPPINHDLPPTDSYE